MFEVVRGDDLKRKLWVFRIGGDGVRIVLKSYHEQERPSTRHKFKGKKWDSIDERGYYSGLKRPTHIPTDVIDEARAELRLICDAAPIYLGFTSEKHLYHPALTAQRFE